jgi:hypothetical protein
MDNNSSNLDGKIVLKKLFINKNSINELLVDLNKSFKS